MSENTKLPSDRVIQELREIQCERAQTGDKIAERVMTLASGLIALTITFRGNLTNVAISHIEYPSFLFAAWVLLALTIGAGLFVLNARADALRQRENHIGLGLEIIVKPRWMFRHAFKFMVAFFLAAICSFIAFAITNTGNENISVDIRNKNAASNIPTDDGKTVVGNSKP